MHLGNRHLLRRADAAIRALPTRRTSGPGARGDARPADADLCRRLCRARAGGGVSVHALSLRPRRTRSPPRPDGRERGSRGRAARITEPAAVQETGRGPCWEKVWQDVSMWVVADVLNKKN